MRDWATELGLNAQIALAGFWGGVIGAFVARKATLIEVVSTVVTGTATANYLGAVAVKYTGAPELATGFIVGLSGMIICRGIIGAAQAFRFGNKAFDDASKK